MRPVHVAVAVACAVTASLSLAARQAGGAPQPQGQQPLRPPAAAPGQATSAPRPAVPPVAAPAPQPPPTPTAAPGEATEPVPTPESLGLPVYPTAQYLATYNAGRGQKYVLFGTTAAYAEVVGYYRNQLGNRGDQVFREPLTHVFEVGRFREETMAFPPGVTVKDWTSGGSQGYPHPQADAQTVRYPTVIMLVPQPPPPPPPAPRK